MYIKLKKNSGIIIMSRPVGYLGKDLKKGREVGKKKITAMSKGGQNTSTRLVLKVNITSLYQATVENNTPKIKKFKN